MRLGFAAVLLLLLGLAGPGAAQAPADRDAIQNVIRGQMDAFGRDDAPAAFGFAAPSIQGLFDTPERFIAMARQGYAPVYRPRAVDFTTLTTEDGVAVQKVELIGPDGLAYTATYTMEHEPDGTWRIAGCSLVASRRLGV